MVDPAQARAHMVEAQLVRRGICDDHVLNAMRQIPREAFVGAGFKEFAYDNGPLPIGHGQTISQPYIVALMIEAAGIRPGDRVLEIGAGSGYAAAVMAAIADQVHTIERHAGLGKTARARLKALGIENVDLHIADGTLGWPEAAPFDAIIVAAASASVPQPLKEQLREGGHLIIPVGDDPTEQKLRRLTRTAGDCWEEDDLGGVRFVPLIGAQG